MADTTALVSMMLVKLMTGQRAHAPDTQSDADTCVRYAFCHDPFLSCKNTIQQLNPSIMHV